MRIAARNIRATWAAWDGLLIGIVAALLVLAAAFRPIAATEVARLPSAYSLIPAQLSMGRPGFTRVPPQKRVASPAKPPAGRNADEQKRLAEAIHRMTPKQRKRFAKAVKHMTPEQRQQFAAIVKQQLAKRTAR